MKYTVIAPIGDNLPALYIGIRDFPTEKVILLTPESRITDAQKASKQLEQFKIPVTIIRIKGNIWEEMFKSIAEIKERYQHNEHKQLLVNTATGDRMTTCAATSAAFVNGLKAISIEGEESMLLPVLKFSYYRLISDKKISILTTLAKEKNATLQPHALAKKTGMSLPLLSYHLHGNHKCEGLENLGLVQASEHQGRPSATLTMLGRLIVKGYVRPINFEDKR